MTKNNNESVLPILSRGEKYVRDENPPGSGGGPKIYPKTFDQVRQLLLPQLKSVQEAIGLLPATHRIGEVVLTVDLLPDFLAKSYFPGELLDETKCAFIGSRSIQVPLTEQRKAKRGKGHLLQEESRKLFLSATDTSIEKLLHTLDKPTKQSMEQQFQRFDSFSLQTAQQKMFGLPSDFDGLAEIVLHGLPDALRNDEIGKLLALCKKLRLRCNPERIRVYPEGPIFCPIIGNADSLLLLAEYNPLRAVRPMPTIPELTAIRSGGMRLPTISSGFPVPPLVVGMFDGGVDTQHPALKTVVREESLTPEKALPQAVAHGTAVASALAYGPIDVSQPSLSPPCVGIHSFRVFPVPKSSDDGELNYIIDQIENIVPQRDLKIYNLSFGPRKPIEDYEIDRFTYVLDRLALRGDRVFFIAVGNDGEASDPYNRIQPASDMANGVGVAALTRKLSKNSQWEMIHAPYSCVGPGRQGAKRKPDISAFGGSSDHPFLVLGNGTYDSLNTTYGTSFACPVVAGLAGNLLNTQQGLLNPLAVRALLLHTANGGSDSIERIGAGEAATSVEEMLRCSTNAVTIVYQDEISYGGYCRLPVLLPDIPKLNGNVKIKWTLVYLPKVNPNSPDEYTLEQVDVAFRPHDQEYPFTPPKGSQEKRIILNVASDKQKAEELVARGYKKGQLPNSKTPKKLYMTEQDLRTIGKWNDTVVVGNGNTRFDGLRNPSLTLHIEERYGRTGIQRQEAIRYACVITIETKKDFDLYRAIRQQFRELTPLRIREQVRI